MKALFYTFLTFIFTIGLTSCSQDNNVPQEDFEPIGNIITMSRTFTVPSATRAGENGQPLPPTTIVFEADFDDETEFVLGYRILHIDGVTEAWDDLGITKAEFEQLLIAELGPDFMNLNRLQASDNPKETTIGVSEEPFSMSKCLSGCHDQYTDANGKKLPGRGNCKFGCWIDMLVYVAKKIIPFL